MSLRFRAGLCRLLCCLLGVVPLARLAADEPSDDVFRRDNLVAWCIVPFDDRERSPEERAAMLERIGIRRFAYDYRAHHIPTFDAEVEALQRHGIELTAWWFPPTLNDEARLILDVLRRHDVQTQLWVTGGGEPTTSPDEHARRVTAEAERIRPIAVAAAEIGCTVGLYNHGGWFGEPENQIAVLRELDLPNVGLVYNQHHGHHHVDRFAELLERMTPHLLCLNLNGMVPQGDARGQKIVPLGRGPLDLRLLRIIRDSDYRGPIGILNHTQHDAEARLLDNLDGLKWLTRQLNGESVPQLPELRSPDSPPPPEQQQSSASSRLPWSTDLVASLIAESREHGDAARGAIVFSSPKFACLSCHRIGQHGGTVGPELTAVLPRRSMVEVAESFLWPQRDVDPRWHAWSVVTRDGLARRGYITQQSDASLTLTDPTAATEQTIARADIDEIVYAGSLMPDGLASAMSPRQRIDVFRLLLEIRAAADQPERLRSVSSVLAHAATHAHAPAAFAYDAGPIEPDLWPQRHHHINRDRLYDFYLKQARHFRSASPRPALLAAWPGLDGGRYGHWGNQDDTTWADGRWNQTDLGTLQCGVFHGAGVTVPRGVCVRFGEDGALASCFNPERQGWDATWTGGFLQFSEVRHGFLGGVSPQGAPVEPPPQPNWAEVAGLPSNTRPRVAYRGIVRFGPRIAIVYRVGGRDVLEIPEVRDGRLVRTFRTGSPSSLPLEAQWPDTMQTPIELGNQTPWSIDTVELPFENPWNALIFPGGHAFLPDGSALICTMQGDVWHVRDFSCPSRRATWRRFASGLHHLQGIVVDDRGIFVLGRDQITRLHDLNSDGEADFYECWSDAFETSPRGHDFICGLECDAAGRFYTASGNQGLVRISTDGQHAEVLAEGFRNPDGLGIRTRAGRPPLVTVPCSEGEWTPASMICGFYAPGDNAAGGRRPFFGYRGPRNGEPPDLPLVYLPRGLDNSAGGQCVIDSDRWGPVAGLMLHFSFGTATHFLLVPDEVNGQLQAAVIPLPGEFRSGAHRGRFHPQDGQLYVTGMQGWGSYGADDGSFQRVRYTGASVTIPVAWRAHRNGVWIQFSGPLNPESAADVTRHFAQCWNYRYGPGYGSPEFAPSHFGMTGHESVPIRSAHLLPPGDALFLEMPELQPVNQLHLLIDVGGRDVELYATVHELAEPFTDYPGYRPVEKSIRAHPIALDLRLLASTEPNPWEKRIADARPVTMRAAGNLSFETRAIRARPGEPLQLTFENPDVVPHNWALVNPGKLQAVGELCNRLVADPDAVLRHYIPESDDVLVWTDIVSPASSQTIWFRAPGTPGHYPYLCTFPGHWPVMNGVLIVEAE